MLIHTRTGEKINHDDVLKWRNRMAAEQIGAGLPSFMGKPDHWYEDLHFACQNGHVSANFLKCEEDGDVCLGCMAPVCMISPMNETEFVRQITST